MSSAYRSGRGWQLALALLYVAYYAWLLVAGHGAPYVMDGGESFTVLWHAYNLFHFDFGASLGLTDEALSPHAAAHPYLSTLQGNFPRLFAFLIYALGARTIELQVVATTAVVGSASLALAYRFFARAVGPRFAAIYCALLMTDYILYAQWHVVTFRVWSGFFVFALLTCLNASDGPRRGRALALLFLIGFALFFSELAFAVMLSIAAAVYAAMSHWRRAKAAAGALATLAAGALAALALLALQTIARFGVDVAGKDLHHALIGSAFTRDGVRALAGTFFETHHIAYWPATVDGSRYRRLEDFVFSLSHYDLQVYTPVFCLAVALLLVGAALGASGAGFRAGARQPPEPRSRDAAGPSSPGQRATDLILLAHLAGALFLVLRPIAVGAGVFALYPASGHGTAPAQVPAASIIAALAAAGGAVLIVKRATGSWWKTTRMPPWLAVRLLALLALAGAALAWQKLLYDGGGGGELAGVWMLPLAAPGAVVAARIGIAAALAVAVLLAIGGAPELTARHAAAAYATAGRFVVAGIAGYAAVYWFSPGIVLGDFQWRYAPYVVFFLCAAPAAAFDLLARAAARGAGACREGHIGGIASAGAAAALLLAGVIYWAEVQASYIRLLPPDHDSVFRRLAEPPFRSHGLVSNSNAAPMTAFSGEWGYSDAEVGRDRVTLTAEGYVLGHERRSHLWFADRDRNPAYAAPDFYVCFMPQNFASAAMRRVAQQHGWATPGGCSAVPLVADAGKPGAVLHNEVVARDAPERDYWAVLRLDRDYPPYVRTLEATPRQDASGREVVPYRAEAAQQQGVPLLPPLAELVAAERDFSCKLAPEHLKVLTQSEDGSALQVPNGFTGTLAVRYTPRTATRSGRAVLSRPWRVTADGAEPCPLPVVDYSFAASRAPTTWELDGWGDTEPWGTWTVGPVARLVPDIHVLPNRDLLLTAEASAFVSPAHPSVEATVRVNGAAVARWAFALGLSDRPHSAEIARSVLERRMPPEISFEIALPASPLALGISSDGRELGLALRRLELAEGAAAPATLVEPGETLDFSVRGNGVAALGEGWAAPGPAGSWGVGRMAQIRLALARPLNGNLVLRIAGTPLLAAGRPRATVEVAIDDLTVGSLQYELDQLKDEQPVKVPSAALVGAERAPFVITLRVPDARSPKELGLSDDPRALAFFLRRLQLEQAP